MSKKSVKAERDLEKAYSAKEFAAKLRRLADAIEQNKRFRVKPAIRLFDGITRHPKQYRH